MRIFLQALIEGIRGGVRGKRSRGHRVLEEVLGILRGMGIPCWLTAGTLLGHVREGDFISHDPDIDLGVWISDYDPSLPKAFQDAGFRIRFWGSIEEGMEISVTKGPFGRLGETKVDLFFFMPHPEGGCWHAVWPKEGRLGYLYKDFDVVKARFRGLEVGVPSDVKAFVESQYGPDWRVPDLDWAWDRSPFNLFSPTPLLWNNEEWEERVTVVSTGAGRAGGGAGMAKCLDRVETPLLLHLPEGATLREGTNLSAMAGRLDASGWDMVGGNVRRKGRHSFSEGLLEREGGVLMWKEGRHGVWDGWSLHDIVPPFFLAVTRAVREVGWDPHLTSFHHLDFFLRAKGRLKIGKAQELVADWGGSFARAEGACQKRFLEKHGLEAFRPPPGPPFPGW